MNYLAGVKQIRGDYPAAGQLYAAALAICDREQVASREVAAILVNQGRLLSAQGRFDEAEVAARKSLQIHEQLLGLRDPSVSDSLDVLAWTYVRRGRYRDAEELLSKSVAIREEVGDEAALAGTLNDTAYLRYVCGQNAKAEELYVRVLEIRRRLLGPNDSDVADTMVKLADVYRASRRFSKAERLLSDALPIIETTLGPQHPRVANACNNLGVLYCDERRFGEALPLFERARQIYERTYEGDQFRVGSVLSNLALVQTAERRFREAERLYQRALEIEERTIGPDQPDVAAILNNLGQVYAAQHRYAAAETAFVRAIGIWERSAGPAHPNIAGCLTNYAAVLRKLHRKREAEEAETRASVILAQADGLTQSSSVVDWHDLRRNGR
jgi:tetratricopeptide (TPR) repeat protein